MKKLCMILVVLLLSISVVIPCFAQGMPRLVDGADLLTDYEEAALLTRLDNISNAQDMDVVIVTTDTLEGKSPMSYADDFYDYNGYGEDGVLLLISMEDNDWWISTAGYGITAFTDAGIDYLADRFIPSLSDGDFARAFEIYADDCDEFITRAKSGDAYDVHNLPKEPFALLKNLGICAAIGLVVAFIVTTVMKGQLKTVRSQDDANNYVKKGSMNVTHRQDLFLYQNVTRTPRPKNNGGSGTHRSSSGRSHGGGGGKF